MLSLSLRSSEATSPSREPVEAMTEDCRAARGFRLVLIVVPPRPPPPRPERSSVATAGPLSESRSAETALLQIHVLGTQRRDGLMPVLLPAAAR